MVEKCSCELVTWELRTKVCKSGYRTRPNLGHCRGPDRRRGDELTTQLEAKARVENASLLHNTASTTLIFIFTTFTTCWPVSRTSHYKGLVSFQVVQSALPIHRPNSLRKKQNKASYLPTNSFLMRCLLSCLLCGFSCCFSTCMSRSKRYNFPSDLHVRESELFEHLRRGNET